LDFSGNMLKKLFNQSRVGRKSPRWWLALAIALISDVIGFFVVLLPPVQWAVDAITAVALLVVLGFRWTLFLALVIEVIPAIELFPAWTLWVLALEITDKRKMQPQKFIW
jgi:hypothetical protein